MLESYSFPPYPYMNTTAEVLEESIIIYARCFWYTGRVSGIKFPTVQLYKSGGEVVSLFEIS